MCHTFLAAHAQLASLAPRQRAESICNSFNYASGNSWQEFDSSEQSMMILFLHYGDLHAELTEKGEIG